MCDKYTIRYRMCNKLFYFFFFIYFDADKFSKRCQIAPPLSDNRKFTTFIPKFFEPGFPND